MSKKIYTGKVVSDRMDKTVVVAVTRQFQHPAYKKIIKKVTKFKAHDAENRCKVGDVVSVTEMKPLSKEKRFLVLDIIEKA